MNKVLMYAILGFFQCFLLFHLTEASNACAYCMRNTTHRDKCEAVHPNLVAEKRKQGMQLVKGCTCMHCSFYQPCACNPSCKSLSCAQTCDSDCRAIYTCDGTYIYVYKNYCNFVKTNDVITEYYKNSTTTSKSIPYKFCDGLDNEVIYYSLCSEEKFEEVLKADDSVEICIKIENKDKPETRPSKQHVLREACETDLKYKIVNMEECKKKY